MKAILTVIMLGAVLASTANAQQVQTVDVELGKPLKLLDLGGPNVDLIINNVDQFDVTVTTLDFEHTQLKISGNIYSVSGKEQPTVTRKQIKKEDSGVTPIFSRGNISACYVASMETSLNHAKIAIRVTQ